MVNILFALIGMIVLDHILSQNRRPRRPHYLPYFRENTPYSSPPYERHYGQETSNFSHYSPHYRPDFDNFAPHQRTQSPLASTLIFVLMLIGLFYFLGH